MPGSTPVLAEHYPDDPEGHAARAVASLRKSRNGQRGALEMSPVVADPVAGLVLRRPGLDERLPGLRILYDSAFARDAVARLTAEDPGPVLTRLMAHRLGKRAVVRIDAQGRRYFARLRAIKSTDGETRLARHHAVWKALSPEVPLAIPRPLGAMPEIGLSLFGELPGQSPRFDRDHEAIAVALAGLRRLDIGGLPVHTGADEAGILRGWLDKCRAYSPELAEAIGPILDRVCGLLTVSTGALAPCHRDLHEKQILVSGSGAGFLDFDTLSLADPALDPGNLLAHLFFAAVDEGPLARALAGTGVDLWRRAALLRLAMIYAFTSMSPVFIRRLIREAAG